MNLSRRSLLRSLIAAPAVIAADRLMPIKLWVPTIYGDAIHDDYEGIMTWLKGERVNILPRGFSHNDDVFNMGEGIFRISKGIDYPGKYSLFGSRLGKTTIEADPGVEYVIGVGYDKPSGTLGGMEIRCLEARGRWPFENLFSEK